MTASKSDLHVENLSFSYPEYPGIPARRQFTGLDFQLQAGAIAVVLAQPDQGKTTLCRVLAGLLPRFSGGHIGGAIRLGSEQLLEHPPYQLIEQVGLVFQHPGEQLLGSRCDSEIVFALESLGLAHAEMEIRLERALQIMDLERYRYRSPKNLSGGEKKKLLIACLLAIEPKLWLLDETLEELDRVQPPALVSLAVKIGRTRLIDNMVLE